MLIKYKDSESANFFSEVRRKPEVLKNIGQISYQLRTNDNPFR